MQLTDEQIAIVNSTGDIKINAVAGSGKTTTLIAYAKKQAPSYKILYLAFNKSVRTVAQKRFADEGLTNVDIQTAHSLAYRRVVFQHGYKITAGYKSWELKTLLSLDSMISDVHAVNPIAWHISRYVSLFCGSTAEKVADLDYPAQVTNEQAHGFASAYKKEILLGTRRLLALMDKNEIAVTHEFYLKKFQLSKPRLNYDLILFDEGQDASPVMLHIFLSQKAQKVIVGDIHQQIYGWRHAVNALGSVDFKEYPLSRSFRFDSSIAEIAVECLAWKKLLDGDAPEVRIRGTAVKTSGKIKTKAVIARTNVALFNRAIEMVAYTQNPQKLYFEGNLNSYIYASEGTSLYDVLNLYLDQTDHIRDPLVKQMQDFDQLTEYAEKSDDKELGMLIDLVTEHGRRLPFLISRLKEAHVEDAMRDKASVIFSTVHRCKGMEYDSVELLNDFVNRDTIKRLVEKKEAAPNKIEEEINLVYVAITRTKKKLILPPGLFPDFQLPEPPSQKMQQSKPVLDRRQANKSKNAYQIWTPEMDLELGRMVFHEKSIKEMTTALGRNNGAIRSRIKKLGLYGLD
jgi:superfamily I DNA/RNA helicase